VDARASADRQGPERRESSTRSPITFGLLAEEFLLPEEDAEEYVRFANALLGWLAATGMVESTLAARIVGLSWRLQRAGRLEQYLVEAVKGGDLEPKQKGRGRPRRARQLTDGEAIADLLLRTQAFAKTDSHEGHLERCLHRNLAAYRQLQKERREREAEERHRAQGAQN
jgi:hypothetical protein